MRRARLLLCFVALAAAWLPAGRALAYDGPGCGTDIARPHYTGTATCKFAFRGFPILVQGDSDSTGTASVHVFITISGYPEIPPLFECSGTGSKFAKCDAGYPDDTTKVNIPPQVSTVYLDCHVVGSGVGKYWCQSGTY